MLEKKTKLLIAAAILAVALLVGPAVYAAESNDDYTVKASVNKDCSGTPWFVGVENNFFKNGGVNFDDVGQIAGPQRNAAFIAGQIDVEDGDPQSLINMLKAGVKVKAIAQSGDEPTDGDINKEHMHWDVLKDSPIKTPADIAKQPGTVKISVVSLGIAPIQRTTLY